MKLKAARKYLEDGGDVLRNLAQQSKVAGCGGVLEVHVDHTNQLLQRHHHCFLSGNKSESRRK